MSFRDNLKGQLYREGKTLNQKPLEVYDHDWASLAEGQVIPHGLYPTFRT